MICEKKKKFNHANNSNQQLLYTERVCELFNLVEKHVNIPEIPDMIQRYLINYRLFQSLSC